MKSIILDYGTGNIQSVQNALEHLGHSVQRTSDANHINRADLVIFPGQGSFGPAIKKLTALNCINPLKTYIKDKRPFIGICLGFQLLFDHSEESANTSGLNCFTGTFKKFKSTSLSVPHMGWNKIKTKKNNTVLDHFNNERFYFVHSYYYHQQMPYHFHQPFMVAIHIKHC